MIRLDKYLSSLEFVSRRKIEDFLKENKVLINNKRVIEPGFRVDINKDQILVNNKPVDQNKKFVYILLNKPAGVISTVSDEQSRKTVIDLVKIRERIYPVGRLDENTTGLILLTNDGELTNLLTHPKNHIPKTYLATITEKITDQKLNILSQGVSLKDGKTAPAKVEVLESNPKRTVLEMTIHEGKNHQIKRMLSALNLNLISLKRIAIGKIILENLEIGQSRSLTKEEVRSLKEYASRG